jgi:DNA-binding NarL/FixJ family response regulator
LAYFLIALGQVRGCLGATTASFPDAMLLLRQSVQCPKLVNFVSDIKLEKVISNQSLIRVLLVDDFADWRSAVHAKLGQCPRLQVVGFAADGVEAVVRAKELQPDLILLDIGLPKLNGIGAAREIRKISTGSKIVFLSQQDDPDIVRAAIGAGGHGYVVKSDAEGELFAALQAVMLGKKFVSRSLADHEV